MKEYKTINQNKVEIEIGYKEELSAKLHKGEVVDESYPKEFIQETLEEFVEWIDMNYFSYDKLKKDTLLKRLLDIYIENK